MDIKYRVDTLRNVRLRETYQKYMVKQVIDPEDIEYLRILADGYRIQFSFHEGEVYAESQ